MAKLQAATISSQPVRKNKRKAISHENEAALPAVLPITSTSTVATKTNDGGKKARRAPKNTDTGNDRPSLLRRNSSSVVESSVPWPDELTKLAQTHRALNLVYTFSCTRKHLATPF